MQPAVHTFAESFQSAVPRDRDGRFRDRRAGERSMSRARLYFIFGTESFDPSRKCLADQQWPSRRLFLGYVHFA